MIRTVSSQTFPGFPDPRSDYVIGTTTYLTEFYQKFAFYRDKIPDYLCGLAARYAASVMPKGSQKSIRSFALWLSLVWIIDGMVDSGRISDLTRIIAIIQGELVLKEIRDPLEILVYQTFAEYLNLIAEDRKSSPDAYRRANRWLLRYLSCQGKIPQNFPQYQNHRLRDGGMMCVMWQLIMYNRLTVKKTEVSKVLKQVALIVSYHNDLLSFDRDFWQETPNLLNYLGRRNIWYRFGRGVEVINALYRKVSHFRGNPRVKEICHNVLNGSHNWALRESRYEVGIKLLTSWENGDRRLFREILLSTDGKAAGDPVATPK